MESQEKKTSGRISRRDFLSLSARASLLLPLAGMVGCKGCGTHPKPVAAPGPVLVPFEGSDEQLLEDLTKAAYQFFWDQGYPSTGLVKDRTHAHDSDTYYASSVAAVGFGLAALCIGESRGYGSSQDIRSRVLTTLDTLVNQAEQYQGFFYHFMDWTTGKRIWNSELSSVDTAILMCGVLVARQYFGTDSQIVSLATQLYNNVNWPWMLNEGTTLSQGWTPESGFLGARWSRYCELMMLYLLGIGSPTYPLPPNTWNAFTRPTYTYQGITYISGGDPLFTHQFSHAFFDFRDVHDAYADYFENSVSATEAHRLFCIALHNRYPDYSDLMWGITASDSINGYEAWGGPPLHGLIDGTLVPCAPAGSLPFRFSDCIQSLRMMRSYPRAWSRYGFVDAFNPLKGFYNADVLGIDLGITILMAENYRTNFVWNYFMQNLEALNAMKIVGFEPNPPRHAKGPSQSSLVTA